MKKFKKIIALTMLTILAIAAFAGCAPKTYTVTVAPMENGRVLVQSKTFQAKEKVILSVRPDEGYKLVPNSLKANGVETEREFVMPKHNVEITAEFARVPVYYQIAIAPDPNNYGGITASNDRALPGETVFLKVKITGGCELVKDSLRANNHALVVTNDGQDTFANFVMPEKDVTVKATFRKMNDANVVEFGAYPQTLASFEAEEKMSAQPQADGYYVSSFDNCKYAALIAKPYAKNSVFADTTEIISGRQYFFKIEPIQWQVLTASNGEKFLTTELLLDNQAFLSGVNMNFNDGEYYNTKTGALLPDPADPTKTIKPFANNWEHSDIRNWLNDGFVNKAFSLADQEKIIPKSLRCNGDVSFKDKNANGDLLPNKYADSQTNTTRDKVFLLSYSDVTNIDYNFGKKAVASDFARANGVYYSNSLKGDGGGAYCLRTAGTSSDIVSQINKSGILVNQGMVITGVLSSTALGVRPCIWL
ncbi:MAG: DUF6273 domain-containing protein [Clostridia bacterium]